MESFCIERKEKTMNKYSVEITETLQKTIEVEAENATEAYKKVNAMYRDEDIVLDSEDFIDFDIDVVAEEKDLTIIRLNKEDILFLKDKFPTGTKVKVTMMKDRVSPVPPGTIGEVIVVDDIGTIHVAWENGQELGLVYGVDRFEKYKPTRNKSHAIER